ncbi:porin [Candidatus Spongiihabitans sp.]|uniref:porin n=1 Tax=Candidatus Spongiihabitans sp. TaxID=3101308 RepID=UPI003C7DCF5C
MNKKLLAAAVSAAVMAPVAHAESSFYARVNNAIDINDLSGDGTTDISGVGSRFGFKGNADIGNGLTAHGRYEFSTVSDKEGTGVGDTRLASVGLSGGFGRVDVGNQWSAYYDTFGTLVSPTYSLGYYLYSSVGGGPFRTSNTIKYSNTFGPLYAELDVRLDDGGSEHDDAEKIHGDGIGLGLSFSVTDNITIAVAFDSEDGTDGTDAVDATDGSPAVPASDDFAAAAVPIISANGVITPGTPQIGTAAVDAVAPTAAVPAGPDAPDTDRVGVGVKVNLGAVAVTLGWQNYSVDDNENTAVDDEVDIDTMFINASGSLGEKTSWYLGYSEADDGADAVPATDDSTQLTWGIYHNLGGGMKLYYEATSLDSENKGWDGDRHYLGMRIDF